MWKPEVGEFVWYASNSSKWPRNRSVYRVRVMRYNEETGKYQSTLPLYQSYGYSVGTFAA